MRAPLLVFLPLLAFPACKDEEPDDTQPEADSDTDTDADTDADSDADTDVPCGADWEPFGSGVYCADCQGGGGGTSCWQECQGCPDGSVYRAECSGPDGTCSCLIDGVEVCTCTSSFPDSAAGCQPEAWGGANCCWNVG